MSGSLAVRCTAYLPKLVHMTDKSIAQNEADGVLKHDQKPKQQIEEAAGAACEKSPTAAEKTCSPAEVWAQISATVFHKGAMAAPDKSESTVKLPGLEFEHPRLEVKSFVALLTETFKPGGAHYLHTGPGHFEKFFEHLRTSAFDRQPQADRHAVLPSHSNWLREAVEKKLVEKANPFSSIVQVGLSDDGGTGIKSKVNIFEPTLSGKVDSAANGEKNTVGAASVPVNPFQALNRVALKDEQNAGAVEVKTVAPPVVKSALTTGEGGVHSSTQTVSSAKGESGPSGLHTVNLPVSSQKHTIDRSDSLAVLNQTLSLQPQIPTIFFNQLLVKEPDGNRKALAEPLLSNANSAENQGVVGSAALKVATLYKAPVVLEGTLNPSVAATKLQGDTHLPVNTVQPGKEAVAVSLSESQALPVRFELPTIFFGQLVVREPESNRKVVAENLPVKPLPAETGAPFAAVTQVALKEEGILDQTGRKLVAEPLSQIVAAGTVVKAGSFPSESVSLPAPAVKTGAELPLTVTSVQVRAGVQNVALTRLEEPSLPVQYQIPGIVFSQLLVKNPDSLPRMVGEPVKVVGVGTNAVGREVESQVAVSNLPLRIETTRAGNTEAATAAPLEPTAVVKTELLPVKANVNANVNVNVNVNLLAGSNPFAAVTQVALKEEAIVDNIGRKVVSESISQNLAVGPVVRTGQLAGEVTVNPHVTAANPGKIVETTLAASPSNVAKESVGTVRLEGQALPYQNQVPTIAFNQLLVKEPDTLRKTASEPVLSQSSGSTLVNRVIEPTSLANPSSGLETNRSVDTSNKTTDRMDQVVVVKAPPLESNANPFRTFAQLTLKEDSIADSTGNKVVLETLPQAQAVALQGQTVYKVPLPSNDGNTSLGAPVQVAARSVGDGNVTALPVTVSPRTVQEADLPSKGQAVPVLYQVPTLVATQLLVKDPEAQLRRNWQEPVAAVQVVAVNTVTNRVEPSLGLTQTGAAINDKIEPSALKVQPAQVAANPFQSAAQVALREDAVVDRTGKAVEPVVPVFSGSTVRIAENTVGAKVENTVPAPQIQNLSQPATPTILVGQLVVKEPEPPARKSSVESTTLVANAGEQQGSLVSQNPQTVVAQRNEQPFSGNRLGTDTKVVALPETTAPDKVEPPVVAKPVVVPVHSNPFQAVMQVALKEDAIVDNSGKKVVVEPVASSTLTTSVPVAAKTALTTTETVAAAPVNRNLTSAAEGSSGQNVVAKVAVADNSTAVRVADGNTVAKVENVGNVGNGVLSPQAPTILASQLLVKEPEPTVRRNTSEPLPVLTAVTESQGSRSSQTQTLPVVGNRLEPVTVAVRTDSTAEKVETPVLAKAPLPPANTNANPFLALTQVALKEDGIVDTSGKRVVAESLPQPVYGAPVLKPPVVAAGESVATTTTATVTATASTTVSTAKTAVDGNNQAAGAAAGLRAVETVSSGKVESNPTVIREQQPPTILASQLVVREPEPLQRRNYVDTSSPSTISAESQNSRNLGQPLTVVSSNRVEPLPITNRVEPALPEKIEPTLAKAPLQPINTNANPFLALTQVALKEDGIVDNSGKKVVAEVLPQSSSGATVARMSVVTAGDTAAPTVIAATSVSSTKSAGEVTSPVTATPSGLRAVETVSGGKLESSSTVIREQQAPTILASQLVVKDPEQPRKNYVDSSQLLANSGEPQSLRNLGQPLPVPANRVDLQPNTTRVEATLPEKSEPALAKAPAVQTNPFHSVTQVALREDGIADAGGKKIAFEPLVYTSIAPVLARSVLAAADTSSAAPVPKPSAEPSTVASGRSGSETGVTRVENTVPGPLLVKEPLAVALPSSPKALTPGPTATSQPGAKELAAESNLPLSVPSASSPASKAVSLANQLVGKEGPTGKGEAVVGVETVGAKAVAGPATAGGIGAAAVGSEGSAVVSKGDGVGSGKLDPATSTTTKGEGTLTAKGDALTTVKGDALTTAKSDTLSTVKGDALTTVKGDALTTAKGDALTTVKGDGLTTAKTDATGAVKSDGLTGKTVKVSETANVGNGRGLADGTEKTTTGADKGSLLPTGKGTTTVGVQTGETVTGSVLVAGNGTGTAPSAKTRGEAVTPVKPEGSTVLVPLDTKIPGKVSVGGKETESNVSLDLTPAKTGFAGAGGGSSQPNTGTAATNMDPSGTTGGVAGGTGAAAGAGGSQSGNVDPTLVPAASQPVGSGAKTPFDMSLPPLEIVDAEAEAKLTSSRTDTDNGSKGFGSDDGSEPKAAPSSRIDLQTGRGKPEPSGDTKAGRREERGPRAEDLTAAFQVLAEKRRSERKRKPQKKLVPVRKTKEESGYKPEKKRRCFILKGDTLESLAAQYLGDSDLASLIYEINAGFWWEKRRGGKIYLEFIPGTTIFLPTAEEISNFRRKTSSGKVLHQFEYLTPERIRSLRQALKGGKDGAESTGSKSLTEPEYGSEPAPALKLEQNEQTTLVNASVSAAAEVKQAVETRKAVAYTASLKPYEGQSREEGTRKLLLGGGQASIVRLLSGCISDEALEAGSRISLDASGGQRESFSVARVEVLKDGIWLPVLEYLVGQDSVLKVYSLGGGERVIHLDLPPAVVRGMALNDLNSNRLEYCRKFLLGRKLFC